MVILGKALILLGLGIAAIGLMLWGLAHLPFIGHLPGDIYIRRGNFSFYFPLATCVVLSILLTLLFTLMRR